MENHESWCIPNSTKFRIFLSFSDKVNKALAKCVGKGREDFVIPLKTMISPWTKRRLTRLNFIDFRGGWVGGLATLLEKLEKDGMPQDTHFNPAAVASW